MSGLHEDTTYSTAVDFMTNYLIILKTLFFYSVVFETIFPFFRL